IGATVTYVPWIGLSGSNVNGSRIVWQPARADLNGQPVALTSKYLKSNTAVVRNPNPLTALHLPWILVFQFDDDGGTVVGEVTDRLSQRQLPLAVFLDGQPLMDI